MMMFQPLIQFRKAKIIFWLLPPLILLASCGQNPIEIPINSKRMLFIVSNAHHYGDTDVEAMNHFQEIILAHHEFKQAGYTVDFVSPEGGAIPVGYIHNSDSLTKRYLYDEVFMNQLEATLKPSDINPRNYLGVYYGGGGSAMFTVPESKAIQDITVQIYEQQGGIVSAICHGTAGLAHLRLQDGSYLVAGKKVNGFPDKFENMEADYYSAFPFSIQKLINDRGGEFQFSEEGWDGFTIADDRLITGQDPSSAAKVAQLVIAALKDNSLVTAQNN